jgi:transglutaminase-like putative cysteine protease
LNPIGPDELDCYLCDNFRRVLPGIAMEVYLQTSDIIDWQNPAIVELAKTLALGQSDPIAIARSCFEWVRDEIRHSYDYQMNPVTCRASDVLRYGTGYCYAKSHLLAALLRANGIPAGLCYQRLSLDDTGAPYCLHGLNAVHLPEIGWYRMDARGNRSGVDAQFTPPIEQLAFKIQLPEEAEFPIIFAEPLNIVVAALERHLLWDELLQNLPDCSLESLQDERSALT